MNAYTRVACFLLILSLSVSCTNPSTPAGHQGYVFESPRMMGTGGFQGTIKGPGNFGLSMYRNEVINIDTRPLTFTEKFNILAKDDLNVSFSVHAILKVDSSSAKQIVEEYGGSKWYKRFVKESFRSFVRKSVRAYKSSDLKEKRSEMSKEITAELQKFINKRPFKIIGLNVGNIDYPAVVSRAVEKKLAAQQLLMEKSTLREIAIKDAEIRVEEAKGIAKAQKIINSTLSANYLQHEAIEAQKKMAQSPNHTTVYIPVGTNGLPLIKQSR